MRTFSRAWRRLHTVPFNSDSLIMLSASFCFPQEVALRPSQYEAFVHEKDEWISDKFFTQQRLAGVNPMSLMRVTNCCKGN